MSSSLTTEEAFLWDAAVHWRVPEEILIRNLDWARVASVAVPNRMATILRDVIEARGLRDSLPDAPLQEIDASADRLQARAQMMSRSLADFLRCAGEDGVEAVVLKGLSISVNVYGQPAMRPGGDIDLLVLRSQVRRCIQVLERMGIGAFWPNLMDDRYYERHHLHQQRSSKDLQIWYEIHWAFDHPYTLFTIDYEGMLDRTGPGTLLGQPVRELTPPDLLLSLAVHLVKHAIYLPHTTGRPDLGRAVLADGMLMYFLDVAEVIRGADAGSNWDALVELARETGTREVIGSVLSACRSLLGTPVSERTLASLAVKGGGAVTRRAMNAVVDREIAQYLGEPPSRIWDALLITNGAFILRPIRLLETAGYFFPPGEYLRRRYGDAGLVTRMGHIFRAAAQFARFAWDSLYFALERYRRLKKIGYSTSLFNRLETEE